MTNFQIAVLKVVQLIPAGKVMSYGQVATWLGMPRAARQVGWAMHSLGGDRPDFPWWRVVNNKGVISIKGSVLQAAQLQKTLLEAEGLEVDDNFKLPIKKYRFHPTQTDLAKLQSTVVVTAQQSIQKYSG